MHQFISLIFGGSVYWLYQNTMVMYITEHSPKERMADLMKVYIVTELWGNTSEIIGVFKNKTDAEKAAYRV